MSGRQFRAAMTRVSLTLGALLSLTIPVGASESPLTGEWIAEDGVAHIRVENCDGLFWGAVSWEKEPGIDSKNPDAGKRGRPTLGMPVLLAMKPTGPNRGEGQIYNSENGKIYSGSITLTSRDVLRVKGCVLGFLCGGQNWTRVKSKQQPSGATAPSQEEGAAIETAQEFCANIGERTGPAP
jgi:uncharacterized protein (DUF2147 family)